MSVQTLRRRGARVVLTTFFALACIFSARPAQAQSTTPTGYLEVCKSSDPANPITGSFTFNIAGVGTRTLTLAPTGPGEVCSGPIQLPAGQVLITEGAVTGVGVNQITAFGLIGAPLNRLVRSDLGNREAVVVIVAGDISTETIARFRNFRIPTGVLEVCKDAAPGTTLTGFFQFTISGVAGTFNVPVGACTGPITVPAGSVTITELQTRPDAALEDVVTLPARRLISKNIGAGTAVVTIIAGDVSTQTVARFINRPVTGQLKLCKIAGTGVNIGTNFTISAGGVSYQVPAGPASAGGYCVIDGTFPVGTQVTVQETIPPGVILSNIAVAPANRGGTPNLANGTVLVTIGTGFTEVTFTNQRPQEPPPPGQLKICKIAGPGIAEGTLFTITATPAGGATQTYSVPAGPAALGGFCVLDGTFPVGTAVTVAETIPANAQVTGITVAPAGRGGTPNLVAGTVVATIGTGFTEVTFTNTGVGTLQVCKVAGTNITVGTPFTFSLSPAPLGGTASLTVNAGAGPTGTCSAALPYLIGTVVSATETAIPAGVTVTPSATQTATISATPRVLTFTNNRLVPTTTFQICKIAGAGVAVGTNFTFTATATGLLGSPRTVVVAAGAAPGGTCSASILVPIGTVTVTETVPTGILVLPAASQTVTVSTPTRITFTNRVTNQGCSPGFFKNHLNAFTAPYTPTRTVGSVFTGVIASLAGETLLQALQGGGGPGIAGAQEILLRAAVAALLNSANPNVGFALTTQEVIRMVNAALASNNRQTILNLASQLDALNNRGCPLS